MKILAIESSCDETSAAVLDDQNGGIKVLSNVTATSLSIHAKTGGIIPENAARMQVKFIMPVVIEALCSSVILSETMNPTMKDPSSKTQDDIIKEWKKAKKIFGTSIDAIAVTYGPGLIGSLLVGVETAKTLSFIFNKPLIPVNHLLAHIFANFIDRKKEKIEFPFIGLIVSGGHTDLLYFKNHNNYRWLGGTRDDAAGEALDKIGRFLNLSYPAGPEIETRSSKVEKTSIRFHSPIINEDNFDFSFSGLKTEVMRFVEKSTLNESLINEICYATQKAVLDVLIKKTLKAAKANNCKTILVGGGVSANESLKKQFLSEIRNQKSEISILFPEKKYSTDNGAMIGAYALQNSNPLNWKNVSATPELYFA